MRKKILPIIITLLALCSTKAFATDYDLWVAGVRVTSSNASHITSSGISGSVSYSYSTNTLTLSGANITGSVSGIYGIKSNIPGLKIQLEGSNTIRTFSMGIWSQADLTIQGTGTLKVSSTHAGAIDAEGNLTFNNCAIEAICYGRDIFAKHGIRGTADKTLVINGGLLVATGSPGEGKPIEGFGHLSMAAGESITYPANAYYDEVSKCLKYTDGTEVTEKAAIESVNRSLWVAGHKLGGGNSGTGTYIFTGEDITGTVTYDFGTNTLALISASITPSGDGNYGIESNIPGLKILLVGSNTIDTYWGGIRSEADMTIQGEGTLDVISNAMHAINAKGNLTFNSTIEARCESFGNGIIGTSEKTLTVNGGMLTAQACVNNHGYYTISGFGHLSMTGVSITYPANVHYDENDRRLEYADGSAVTVEVVIEPVNHSLWVAGHKLGGGNSGTGSYTFTGTGITGTVTYDFGSNTLTLNEASVTVSGNNYGIESNIPGLKIQLVGSNTISSSSPLYYDCYSILSYADMTIQGTGTLNVTSSRATAIHTTGNLTIENCTVEVMSMDRSNSPYHPYYAIYGTSGKTLAVNGGSLTAQAHYLERPIYGFGHLSMAEGTSITYPANVHYDEPSMCLKDANGYTVRGKAAIESVNRSLWVAGHKLGSGNSSIGPYTYTFTGTGITGTVTYSFVANTLALSNASITASDEGNYGIESNIPGLKIQLVSNSTNTINTTDYGIYAQADMTIQGTGTLNVSSTYAVAIRAEGNLTFSNCTVEARSNDNRGIQGTSEKTLTVNGGSLTAQGSGTSGYPISDFGHLSMAAGTSITYPANVHYDEASKRLKYANGDFVYGEAVIESVNHSLWVAGHKLTGNSGTHTFTGEGITGSVAYNFGTNTLSLSGASITASGSGNYGIESNIPGLKIQLTGSNSINTYSNGIYSEADMTIQGTGTLNVTSDITVAIYAKGNLTLSSCTVEARSSGNYSDGIYGTSGKTLAVNGGSLTAVGGTNGYPIFGFGHLSMTGSSITYPANAHYDEFDRFLKYADGNSVYGEAVIELVQYDIWVKGTRVTGANASDVLDDGGTVIYDAEENTLTLNGATITSTSDNAIKNQMSGLKIVLVGNNTVNSTIASGIFSNQDFFIEGNGNLYVTGKDGIYAVGCNLTISGGCAVAATGNGGDNYGGVYGSQTKTLTISESTVMAQTSSTNRSGITGFGNLTLNHIEITTPSGGTYHDGNVYDGSTLYYGKYNNQIRPVVICPILYSLFVHGVQVTSVNANDVLNDGGKVIYDAEENTLTLNGARVMSSSDCGISNQIPGLKIVLVGLNTISSTGSIGILSNQDFFIEGSGSLEATGNNGHGICASNCDLTIRGGCTVSATGNGYYQGIYGFSPHTLTISESTVTAWTSSTVSSAITGFSNLTLNNIHIMTPAGGTYHDGNVYNGNEIYYGKYNNQIRPVVISRIPYDLYVKGTQVTSANAFDVLNDGGTVIYDAEENTLTLNGATITSSSGYAIKNQMAGLKIVLVGNNTVSATGSTSIFSNQDFFIEGRGSLVAMGNNSHGICASSCDLTIRGGCTVTASGTGTYNQGIYGFPSHTLTISESVVTAMTSSTLYSAIHGFRNLVLNEMEITTPSGGTYHDGDVYNGSTIYYGKYNNQIRPVVISPIPYQLWVEGTQITAANAPDVFNDGTVSYDAIDNVLTLNGAAISGGGSRGIENKIANLKIALVGNNAITSSSSGIFSNTNFFIEGRGTLNVTGNDGIYASLCNLTIQGGCDLTITGTGTSNYAGIYGSSGKTLTIDRSKVTVSSASTQMTAICNFTTLDLGEVSMTTPANGSYSYGVVKDNGSAYYGQVVISPISYNLYVKDIQVTSANAFDVLNDGGTVIYDAEENVLTLNGAAITCSSNQVGISNQIPGLRIALEGSNTIISNNSGIYSGQDFIIEGRGTLDVTGYDGIYAYYCDLIIRGGCTINAMGNHGDDYGGIYGSPAKTLTISQSKVTAATSSTIYSGITGFDYLVLDDTEITTPYGGFYYYGNVKVGNEVYYGSYNNQIRPVVISPTPYQLWVKGTQITAANAPDVFGDGTVSYDVIDNELTLNGATIEYLGSNHDGIRTGISNLTIKLLGDNNITSGDDGIQIGASRTNIVGPGTLTMNSSYGIYCSGLDCSLTIKEAAKVVINGTTMGVGMSNSNLVVDCAELWAKGETQSIGCLGLTRIRTSITAPEGAVFSTYAKGVVESEGSSSYVKGTYVKITPDMYPLWIAGTQVTSANASHIACEGISGTVSYDAASNTLTLNGATITNEGGSGIETYIENLNIFLVGDNTISSEEDGISLYADATISGTGNLTINAEYGIKDEDMNNILPSLTLTGGCHVNVYANDEGIVLYGGVLTVDGSTLEVTMDEDSFSVAIKCNGLVLNGTEVTAPEDYHFNEYNSLVGPTGVVPMYVLIGPIRYDLWVANTQVTAANAAHITGEGISGTVSYDAATNTLTLDNAFIENSPDGGDGYGIVSEIDGLIIYLSGSNRIEAETGSGLSITNANTTITGGGKMNFAVGQYSIVATDMGGKLLTIEDECEVNHMFQTSVGGISTDGMLRINNAYVYMYGDYPIIANDLMLDYVEITRPAGGWFDATSHQIKDAQGNVATGQVWIEAIWYDLYVADIPVMASNADDILGDGTVSYDAASNTLTLNGATITNTGGSGIDNNIDNLNIFLVGDNTINCEEGITLYADATISGTGRLTINAEYGVHGYEDWQNILPSLILTGGCQVNVNANDEGISLCRYDSDNWEGGVLMVDRSTLALTMDENYYSTTIQCRDLVLNGAEVTVPTGYYFNSDHHLMDSDGSVPLHVVIEPIKYDLWVAGTRVTAINAEDVLGDGTVSYDVATNTLTLNGATVYDAEYGSGIIDYIDGLNIVLEGGNSIETLGGDGISLYANATISGTGRLDVNARYGIYGYDNYLNDLPSLTLEGGCQVSVAATEDGVNIGEGLMNVGGVLTVDNSTLEVTKENSLHTSIKCRDLVLVGTEVVTPEGYHFNEYNSLVGPTGVVPMYVLIGPIRYDLWVAGIQVSPANAAHITGEGISGTVSYDAATNTLTLDNAFIENSPDGGDGYGIVSEIDGLTISLRGENGISSNEDGISLYNVNTSITGGGVLYIYSPYGIYGYSGTNNVTLTISNESTVSLDCSSQGIYLNSMALCIDKSTVEVIGDAYYGVYASNGWQLIDVEITSPYEAYWNGHYVLDAEGQVVGGGIFIEPIRYELYLADTQVTALNVADVLGEGISGTVSYDATTNTLTLNEATITNEGGRGIETDIDNLNIVLVGTNTIQTIDGEGIRLFADATISGTGSLAIEAWYGINGYITDDNVFPSLTLEGGCQVNVDAIEFGISIFWDLESTGGVLTVDNSTLEVTMDENYYLTTIQCRNLVLNGVEVTDPEAYYFNEYYELVGSDDQVPNRVLIEPYNVFTGTVSGDWNNPSNWSKGELPLATSKVHVAAQCVMDEDAEVKRIVIEETGSMNLINGAVLTVETITNSDASRFVITNGQLYCDNEVSGTFHKTVTIADADENGWNAIAVPMNSPSIANLTANTYDIYTYDEDADQNEWQNYKDSPFSFVPGQGYLYANSDFTDLVMTGTFKPSSQTVTIPLSYGAQYEGIRGFNLVGNPYPRKLSMNEIKIGGEPITIYYRLVEGTNGSEFVPCTSGDILPGEGFFIKATEAGQVLTIGWE